MSDIAVMAAMTHATAMIACCISATCLQIPVAITVCTCAVLSCYGWYCVDGVVAVMLICVLCLQEEGKVVDQILCVSKSWEEVKDRIKETGDYLRQQGLQVGMGDGFQYTNDVHGLGPCAATLNMCSVYPCSMSVLH